jgi:hypothetical protein
MINSGASRDELPTKAKGQSVVSTRDSAQKAYLAQLQKAERTRAFVAAQKTNARLDQIQRTEDLKKEAARAAAEEEARKARMINVANNSASLPNYSAQNQRDFSDITKYKVHGNNNRVSNNKVIPENVFVNPKVTISGTGKNSVPSYNSIVADSNFNYATQMNDYSSANPTSDINLGLPNPETFTAGLSAAPIDNEVKTSQLGGDIQHNQTDSYNNVEDLPYQNTIPADTNWAEGVSIGTAGVAAAGIAGLYLLGGRK